MSDLTRKRTSTARILSEFGFLREARPKEQGDATTEKVENRFPDPVSRPLLNASLRQRMPGPVIDDVLVIRDPALAKAVEGHNGANSIHQGVMVKVQGGSVVLKAGSSYSHLTKAAKSQMLAGVGRELQNEMQRRWSLNRPRTSLGSSRLDVQKALDTAPPPTAFTMYERYARMLGFFDRRIQAPTPPAKRNSKDDKLFPPLRIALRQRI